MQGLNVERGQQALAQIPPPGDWQRTRIPLLSGGMRTDVAPNDLPDNAAVQMLNLQLFQGQVQVDRGYGPFASLYSGTAQIAYQVFYSNGTDDLILITTNTAYRYVQSVNQWQGLPYYNGVYYIQVNSSTATIQLDRVTGLATGQAVSLVSNNGVPIDTTIASIGTNTITLNQAPDTTANDFYPAGGTVQAQAPVWSVSTTTPPGTAGVYVNTIQGLSLGQMVGIELTDGTQFITAINAFQASPPAIVFVPGTTLPKLAEAGGAIAPMISLRGSLQSQVQAQSYPPFNYVIFANGVDPLFYWDGTTLQVVPGLPPNTTCFALTVFHESLFVINTVEAGQAFPYRARMSDAGNPFQFTVGVGVATIYDLEDTEDFIQQAEILGPWLILYRETTIMRGSYLGLFQNIIYWEYMVYGEGAVSQGAVSDIGSEHFLVGNQGVYTYDGGYALNNVGDAVWAGFISAVEGDLNPALKNMLFTQYVGEYDECWVVYAPKGQSVPNKLLRVHLGDNGTDAWLERELRDSFVSAQPYLPLQNQTWATIPGIWADNLTAWDSRVFLANVANMLLCPTTEDRVQMYDYVTATENGSGIAWSLTTKELFQGDMAVRTERFVLFGIGVANVSGSLDNGNTWFSIGQVRMTSNNGLPVYRSITFQCVTPYLMLQISGIDPSFVLRWAEVWWEPESEWWGEGIGTWVG